MSDFTVIAGNMSQQHFIGQVSESLLVKMVIFSSIGLLKVIRGGRKPRGRAKTSHLFTRFCSSGPQMGGEHVMEL